MSPEHPSSERPEEVRAREALQGLPRVRADAAYRERLKRDFVTGRIGERPALRLGVPWHRRAVWRIAPAAAALLAVVVWLGDRGPGWTVMGVAGEGIAAVDGTPVPLSSPDELARRLRPGARLEVPDGAEVELATAAGLVVQVTAGTEFTMPAPPGRWLRRRATGAVRRGEIRITTGPAFSGARLEVTTPEASVEVTGTTLAVICEPVGTCVCVFEGVVKMGPRGGSMELVPNGRRRFVFNDGRPPESEAIRPTENIKLGMFRDSRRGWLEGGGR